MCKDKFLIYKKNQTYGQCTTLYYSTYVLIVVLVLHLLDLKLNKDFKKNLLTISLHIICGVGAGCAGA